MSLRTCVARTPATRIARVCRRPLRWPANQVLESPRAPRSSTATESFQTIHTCRKYASPALQAVFLDLPIEGPLADAQQRGGLLASTFGQFQRPLDVILLDVGQRTANQRIRSGNRVVCR